MIRPEEDFDEYDEVFDEEEDILLSMSDIYRNSTVQKERRPIRPEEKVEK